MTDEAASLYTKQALLSNASLILTSPLIKTGSIPHNANPIRHRKSKNQCHPSLYMLPSTFIPLLSCLAAVFLLNVNIWVLLQWRAQNQAKSSLDREIKRHISSRSLATALKRHLSVLTVLKKENCFRKKAALSYPFIFMHIFKLIRNDRSSYDRDCPHTSAPYWMKRTTHRPSSCHCTKLKPPKSSDTIIISLEDI